MAHHATTPAACANCHYAFVPDEPAEFCPRCGQQNHDVNLSFGHVAEEFLEGIFHFDGKVFRTAGLLLFKPGELTRRFLAGHRVPYVPPIRLYVFISFVFFFVLSLQGGHGSGKPMREEVAKNLEKARASGKAGHVAVLPGVIIDTTPDSAVLHRAARRLREQARQGDARAAKKLAALATAERALAGPPPAAPKPKAANTGFDLTGINLAKLPEDPSAAQVDSLIRRAGGTPSFATRLAVRRAVRWRDVTREEVIHQLLRGASIMMFLLMPLAALLLKGVYFRQHRYYIGHLVFTVHMHCFLFLLLTLFNLLAWVPWQHGLGDALWLVAAGYFVVALHRFYEQGWGRTLAKSVLLGATYLLVLGLSMAAVGTVGLLLF